MGDFWTAGTPQGLLMSCCSCRAPIDQANCSISYFFSKSRVCYPDDDISAESDFDMEDVWDDVDGDGDLMSM